MHGILHDGVPWRRLFSPPLPPSPPKPYLFDAYQLKTRSPLRSLGFHTSSDSTPLAISLSFFKCSCAWCMVWQPKFSCVRVCLACHLFFQIIPDHPGKVTNFLDTNEEVLAKGPSYLLQCFPFVFTQRAAMTRLLADRLLCTVPYVIAASRCGASRRVKCQS